MSAGVIVSPLVERLKVESAVQAITVVGSQVSGFAREDSDIDLFVYIDDTTPVEEILAMRRAVAVDVADPKSLRIGQTGHPYADAYKLPGSQVWLDVMFWTTQWAEDELDWRLEKQSPQMGYSTGFWRSIRDGMPLFERGDWHNRLQQRARSPYPETLRSRIIELNRDLLGRDNPFSFLCQIERAVDESDLVAVQHRVAKWLASYFDIVFAANRVLTPGEKRLLSFALKECAVLPDQFEEDVLSALRGSCAPTPQLVVRLETMLSRLNDVLG